MRIRFVCPHCKVARSHMGASSRVLAGHYMASQYQVAMLMYYTTSSNNFACTPCMQAHPCLYLCWHVAISVYQLLQVCRDRCSVK